ncbi:MAG: complex I NDUFA9 subunit family protein [Desulfotomaculum sp.]|nr:complex I NDUFA9 subunit family protein [Desulfotomaculum sp.]
MILVTGATGYVGNHVVKTLINAGEKVRCLVRNANGKNDNLLGGEIARGDITDPVSLAVACTGVTTVVHLVAIIREQKNITFEDINIKGTRNIVQAAQESGVKHFIHISALGAGKDPKFKYAYSKGMAEAAVLASDLQYTILQPSVIFGPGFGFMDRLLQALRMTPTIVSVPGDGSAKFQPIAVKDVARCVLEIIRQPEKYINKSIAIGGPEHLTYEQMLDVLMQVTEIKKTKLHIPLPLVRIGAVLMQWFLSDPPVTPVELSQLALDNTTDINAVEKHFGFTPAHYAHGLEYLRYKLKNQKKH